MTAESMVWATELPLGWELRPRFMAAQLVRSELYLHTDVVDVFPSNRDDHVVVVHTGPAKPAAWLGELREAGIVP